MLHALNLDAIKNVIFSDCPQYEMLLYVNLDC